MENKEKKELHEWWWLCLIAGVIIIGIAAASGKSNNKPAEASNADNSDTKTAVTTIDTDKSKIYSIGDTIEMKNYKITVNKIRTSDGTSYEKPNDGYVYLYVNCTVENISGEMQTVSSIAMFQVENKNGIMYEQALSVYGSGQLDGSLSAGKNMTGDYVVEVPKGQTGLSFILDSCVTGGEKIIINLN